MPWYNSKTGDASDIHPSGNDYVDKNYHSEEWSDWEWVEQDDFEKLLFDLESYKTRALEAVNKKRNSLEQNVFVYNGHKLQCDQVSVTRLLVASQTAQVAFANGVDYSVDWTCADNSVVTFTTKDLIGIPLALAKFSNSLHIKSREYKENIKNSTTKESVDQVLVGVESWEVT